MRKGKKQKKPNIPKSSFGSPAVFFKTRNFPPSLHREFGFVGKFLFIVFFVWLV